MNTKYNIKDLIQCDLGGFNYCEVQPIVEFRGKRLVLAILVVTSDIRVGTHICTATNTI